MAQRRLRMGMRAQLTLTVVLAALLSTAATLFIANNAIHAYALQQATTQARESMKIANLVQATSYGQYVSISSDGQMVLDSPKVGRDQGTSFTQANSYGKFSLNGDVLYVDEVQTDINGKLSPVRGAVSIYQCADKTGAPAPCTRIATTFRKPGTQSQSAPRDTGTMLCQTIINNLAVNDPSASHEWIGEDPGGVCGAGYFGDYQALDDPQGRFIGVIYVGEPLDTVTAFETNTALELLLLGVIVMAAGAVLALLFASAIVNALQRAARQVSGSSERIATIAAQQSGGAAQQVWAVNAVNKALQNFQEMARDIAGRTDQLALMGNQIISRRGEISPAQIDSILAFMTRSVRDISVASRQQAAQFERMSGAMQAVIEIAEQVAGNSQQSSESAERLQLVVRQLQQLVGVSPFTRRATTVSTMMDGGLNGMGGYGAGANGAGGADQRAMGPRGRSAQQLGLDGGAARQPVPVGVGGRALAQAPGYPSGYAQGYQPGYQQGYGMGNQSGYPAAPYGGSGYAGNGYGGNGIGGNGYGGNGYAGNGAGNGYGGAGSGWAGQRAPGTMPGAAPAGAPGAAAGGMSGGMRGGAPDWRMPPLPPMPGGADQADPGASGFGARAGNSMNGNGLANGDAWGTFDAGAAGNEPRRSWAGER